MGPSLKPLSAAVGAEVLGVDLAHDVDDATFTAIRTAFHDRGVLVFRDQQLSDDQHIAFSRRFGELEIHIASQYWLPRHPEIVVLSNRVVAGKPVGIEDAGRFWHSDLSYMARPSLGSVLYAHEVPPRSAGGDTPFAGMYAAYDALDAGLKQRIRGVNAVHSYEQRWQKDAERGMERAELDDSERQRIPDVVHPIARPHPITGRVALYVNEGFTVAIEGWPQDQSQALLAQLFSHATRPDVVYTHHWRAHDLVMWDNACVVHSATWHDPAYIRHLHRTTAAGPDIA